MAYRRRFPLLVSSILALFVLFAGRAAAQGPPLPPQERLCDPAFEDCRADLLSYINQEQVEIDMGFWMMTDARYANALVAAWNRGVKIRLLMDPNCSDAHPACVAQNVQLAAAGIPMRKRQASGILHWKMAILVGQNQLEFAGANFAPFEFTPETPFVNYTDEIVAFTNDPGVVRSFMTKFDDLWTSTTEFVDYANVAGPLTRSFPISPIDPELNFPPDDSYRNRALAAYAAETQKIDVQMFRITDSTHPAAMIGAVNRGLPVRLITDETEYRNPTRLWDAFYVDRMYANGVQVKLDGHAGIDHEKAVLLYGTGLAIFGSSNWTDASSDTQREHNYFTTKAWAFRPLATQFERKWNNLSGFAETKTFVPLAPDAPKYTSPATLGTGLPTSGVTLSWNAGLWAHYYDVYFGTNPNPPLLAADQNLGPSQSAGDDKVFNLPALQPGTTYYWKVVSKTAASVAAPGEIRSFSTAGTPPAPNSAPTVTLTAPVAPLSVMAPADIAVSAAATDNDGTIARVDFYANGALIGSSTSAPFAMTWRKVAAGSYSVTAVATDDRFAAATSTAVTVDVTSAAPPVVTLVRGPYLQQPTDHSMVVVWATREAGSAAVRYTPAGSTVSGTASATSRLVRSADTGLPYDYYQHVAVIAGLAPARMHTYQAFVNGVAVAPQSSFKTAPAPGGGAVSFIAFGDSGTGSPEQRQLAALMSRDAFDFAVHVGDIAYGSSDGTGAASYSTFQSYLFDIYGWLSSAPFVPVEGNHDSRSTNGDGKAYLDLFELPRNGSTAAFPDHAERYYSFDYGPVHFIALDTEFTFLDPVRQGEQLRWMQADLAATTLPWKVAVLHRAPYSSGGEHGSSLDVRAAFGPLFERYGVDLVLTGHEHDYERTIPIRESSSPADHFVPYVVAGGGGAPLYPSGTSSWTAFSTSTYEYVKVTADSCTLTLNAIGITGSPLDSTTMKRCVPANQAPTVALTSPVPGLTAAAPASVALTASASDSDGTVTKVDFFAGATRIGTSATAPYAFTWTNIPAGTYNLTAVATDNQGGTTTSSPVALVVSAASTLPDGWSNGDVGVTGAIGRSSATNGSFSVTGAGADVWGTADAFQFAYRTLDGDGSIVARVTGVQSVANWTKAGVMIRGSLSPASAQAFMLVSWTKGIAFQRRLVDGAGSVSTSGTMSSAPRWVKLTRAGNQISAFESPDGMTWTLLATDAFALGTSVQIGLAVSSHIGGTLATATFDNVSVTTTTPAPPRPNLAPTVALTGPASAGTAPATFTLSATAADSDGTVAKVEFYSGASLLGTSTTSPYFVNVTGLAAGSYSFTAVATDDLGATTTSAPVTVVVAAAPPPNARPTVSLTAPLAGAHVAAPGSFTLRADAADTDGTIVRVEFYAGSTLVGTATSAPYTLAWVSVPAGSYSLTAVAYDNASARSTSAAVAVLVDAPALLPAGWSAGDIGVTGAAGSSSGAAGAFTVTGAGADVWNSSDQLQYAYRALDGDGSIVARVATVQNVANWTKAGVMIRGSVSPSSAQAFMLVSWAKGVAFQRRLSDGATTVGTSGIAATAPHWVKLTRTGSTIAAFQSVDGQVWTLVASDTFAMGRAVQIGLAVSSHVTGVLATGTFDNVVVTAANEGGPGTPPPPPPPPANVAPVVTLAYTSTTLVAPATIALTATASDSDGTIAKVDFYSGGTLIGTAASAPYAFTWSNVAVGTYSVTAVATDNAGATGVSAAIPITVTAPPPPPPPPPPANVAPVVTLAYTSTTLVAPATISLTATASDSDGTIAKVDFYSGGTLIGTAASAPYAFTWSNVAIGTYSVTAVATDNAAATGVSAAIPIIVSAPPQPVTLPEGWAHADIGAVPFAGQAEANAGTYTVTGSGADIWGTADQFHYAYRALTGDGTIVARVSSVQNVATWVKAGLMVRDTLAAGSAQASIFVSAAKGIAFQRRGLTGGDSVNTAGTASKAPRWVKLVRAGNTFTAYESADGQVWTLVGSDTIVMGRTVYVGLAVTSHTVYAAATCTFDNVSIQ